MPKRRNHLSTPPQNSTPHSGASESTQLQWVLHNQNELNERTAVIENNIEHMMLTLEKIDTKLDKVDGCVQKNSTTIKIATAIVLTAGVVIGFMVNGQIGKIHDFMERNDTKVIEPKKTGNDKPK